MLSVVMLSVLAPSLDGETSFIFISISSNQETLRNVKILFDNISQLILSRQKKLKKDAFQQFIHLSQVA